MEPPGWPGGARGTSGRRRGLGGVQALQAEHQLAGDRAEAGEGEDAAGGPSGKVTSRWEG